MKKINTVEWTDDVIISQLDGRVTLDLHLLSVKGNTKVIRVQFDQHDMREIAAHFHRGLGRVAFNLERTRQYLSGEG